MIDYTIAVPKPLKLLTVWPEDLANKLDSALLPLKGSLSVMLDNITDAVTIGTKLQPGHFHVLLMPTEAWQALPNRQQTLVRSRVPLLLLMPLVHGTMPDIPIHDGIATLLILSKVYDRETLLTFLVYLVAQLVSATNLKKAIDTAWNQAIGSQQDFALYLIDENEAIWPKPQLPSNVTEQPPSQSSSPSRRTQSSIQIHNSTIGNLIQNADSINISQTFSPVTTVSTDWMFEQQGISTPVQQLAVKLHQILLTYFDEEELRTLCLYLHVDYDMLPGRGKAGKSRDLLLYLTKRDQVTELITLIQQQRPNITDLKIL